MSAQERRKRLKKANKALQRAIVARSPERVAAMQERIKEIEREQVEAKARYREHMRALKKKKAVKKVGAAKHRSDYAGHAMLNAQYRAIMKNS